jgi:hypothetical protein
MCKSDYVSDALTRRVILAPQFEVTNQDPKLFAPDLDPFPFEPLNTQSLSKNVRFRPAIYQNMMKCAKNIQNTLHSSFEEQGQIHFELPEKQIFFTQSLICYNL